MLSKNAYDRESIESGWLRSFAIRAINGVPSAQPERKDVEWIKEYWNGERTRKCSACGVTQTVTTYRGKVNLNIVHTAGQGWKV